MPDLKCGALKSASHFPLLELKVILDLVATAFWVPHSPLCIYIYQDCDCSENKARFLSHISPSDVESQQKMRG